MKNIYIYIYKVEFSIDWGIGCCCLCKFPLIINPPKFDVS